MKKATKKEKRRIIVYTLVLIPLLTILVSSLFSYWSQIYKNVSEKKQLETSLNKKLSEEANLKSEISKLQDPEYIAKYAREKYMYSKNKEILIRIEEK